MDLTSNSSTECFIDLNGQATAMEEKCSNNLFHKSSSLDILETKIYFHITKTLK